MAPKRKGPRTKGKPIVRNRIENRDNYRRWPWTSFLVLGISTGSIFFMAGSPNEITETTGMSFYLSLIFLTLGTAMLVPSLIVVLILFWYCFLNGIGTQVPEKCQCLYWFAIKNKKVSQSVNFYNHKAKEPAIWTIEGQMRQLRDTNPRAIEATALDYQTSIEFNNNEEDIDEYSSSEEDTDELNKNEEEITEQPQLSGRLTLQALASNPSQPGHSSRHLQDGDESSALSLSSSSPIKIKLPFESYTVHTNHAYSPDEDDIVEVHTPNRRKKKFKSRHNSDGWDEMLIDETRQSKPKGTHNERAKALISDRDSVSIYSDRTSVLTGKSDIPLVKVYPPRDDYNRAIPNGGHKWNVRPERGRSDRNDQRHLGSDRRKKKYNENEKGYPRHNESDKGYNSDRVSMGSSYQSPTLSRSNHAHNKQNGYVRRSQSPNRLDDVVLATQKHNLSGNRSRLKGRQANGYNNVHRKPLPGTTPDKTVFPEKITLNIRGIPSPRTAHNGGPRKARRNGTIVMGTNPDWKQNGHKPGRLHSYNDDVFINEVDDDDDDAYSSNSSWIGIPWHSYKLPPGFQDPNADDELSV